MSYQSITIKRSKRKTLSLQIDEQGNIIVYAPIHTPKVFINQFIHKHQDWINKHISKIQQRDISFVRKKFVNNEKFLFLGEKYPLLITYTAEINSVSFDKTNFYLNPDTANPLSVFEAWYKEQAYIIFHKQVKDFSTIMKLSPTDIKLSSAKTRWGSCNSKNVIRLNWKLVMAPIEIINYVIIHELAHIKEKNHSKKFWSIVEKYDINYKQHRQWLKGQGYLLDLQQQHN